MLCALHMSTTSNWIVCLTTQSLTHHAIFSQTGPQQLVDCLAPFWELKHKVSFPRTQQCIVEHCAMHHELDCTMHWS